MLKSVRLTVFALCLAPAVALADPQPIVGSAATALPVVARHGMVVTQEAAASRVGRDVLRLGGNAVDAAVAVGFALAVTLPRAGNIGGGGFMLIHRADLGRTVAIDYREAAPAATTKDVFLDANGAADPFKSRWSGLAVGVPGTVAGLELAWRKYGSGKFTFADLVAPAIALAREGSRWTTTSPIRCRRPRPSWRSIRPPPASTSSRTGARRRSATTSASTISPPLWKRSPWRAPPGSTPARSRKRSSTPCRRRAGA